MSAAPLAQIQPAAATAAAAAAVGVAAARVALKAGTADGEAVDRLAYSTNPIEK